MEECGKRALFRARSCLTPFKCVKLCCETQSSTLLGVLQRTGAPPRPTHTHTAHHVGISTTLSVSIGAAICVVSSRRGLNRSVSQDPDLLKTPLTVDHTCAMQKLVL